MKSRNSRSYRNSGKTLLMEGGNEVIMSSIILVHDSYI